MANIKSDGRIFDANLFIQTGLTITAGSLIFADVSGTNVVRAIRSYSGVSPESAATPTGLGLISLDGNLVNSGVFLGVICNTQTGVSNTPNSGNAAGLGQTGVSWYNEGIFEFNTTPTSSAALRIGFPVWATNNDTVVCALSGLTIADATGTNSTGTNPIGVVRYLPRGPITTSTVASRVAIEIITGQKGQRPA